jgi:hypothetical protein
MAVVVPGNRAHCAASFEAHLGQGIGQLPDTLGRIGIGGAVQWAMRFARDDFLIAKLCSGVFEDARNEQWAFHHEARLGHVFSLG